MKKEGSGKLQLPDRICYKKERSFVPTCKIIFESFISGYTLPLQVLCKDSLVSVVSG
jgi:hypothetical protein